MTESRPTNGPHNSVRAAAPDDRRDVVVRLEQGAVRGIGYETHAVFYSIPYAAPPQAGGLFQVPRPPTAWPAVRDATRAGATAPQPARGTFGRLDVAPYFEPGWVAGEDYLTVNVWAPAARRDPAPVLVFLHGGGFLAGSSHSPILDGRRFAEDGILVVTVNYRLGIAGFLDLPSALPNRGLADALAALAWVQHNITEFAGDPANVTLAGQSAGATLTAAAVASPDARGLFHRAIMQSGSGSGAFTAEQAAIVTRAAAQALGVEPTLDGFVNLPEELLVSATQSVMGLDLGTRSARDPLQKITPFSVVLDEQPADVLARGGAQPVDLLIGHNAEEGNLYLVPNGAMASTTDRELHAAAAYAHPEPARLLSIYSTLHPHATPGQLRSIILGEAAFGAGTRRLADQHATTPQRTFVYEFTWRSPALNGELGATHIVETPFVFDNLLPSLRGDGKLLGASPLPPTLAATMHEAWVDFVSSGSPGWVDYTLDARATMRIDEHWTLTEDPYAVQRSAWT